MLVFGKETAYWKEKFGGIFLGFIFFILVYLINPEFEKWKEFAKEIPSIGMSTFGFLLVLLGIILQGNSKTIEWMKSRDELFQRFISFNKKIVMRSVLLSSYALFFVYFDLKWITGYFTNGIFIYEIISQFSIPILTFLLVWFLYDVIYFITIFYLLIKRS